MFFFLEVFQEKLSYILAFAFSVTGRISYPLRPIYTVRFLLTIVACDFLWRALLASWKNRIQFPRYDIKLPVATIVVGF